MSVPNRSSLIAVAIEFPHPPCAVWNALTDFPRMHNWFVGVRDAHLVDAAEGAVGAQRSVTFVGGHQALEEVTNWQPPGQLGLRVVSGTRLIASGAEIDIRIDQRGDGSVVVWRITYRPALGRLGAVVNAVAARASVRRVLRRSLVRLRGQL
jgi:hypothetical protein